MNGVLKLLGAVLSECWWSDSKKTEGPEGPPERLKNGRKKSEEKERKRRGGDSLSTEIQYYNCLIVHQIKFRNF